MSTVAASTTDAHARWGPSEAYTGAPERELEQYRPALTAFCRRMVGEEADDAVQETLVRAWLAFDRFERRAALGSWLHRIAYNVCLDILEARQRRDRGLEVLASNLGLEPHVPSDGQAARVAALPPAEVDSHANPAETAVARETVRLAFSTLMRLPARQRAVLMLRDVLRWRAVEVAELLGASVASVNSALQRARSKLAAGESNPADVCTPVDVTRRELLARCLDAFERYDLELLTSLLRDDTRRAPVRAGRSRQR